MLKRGVCVIGKQCLTIRVHKVEYYVLENTAKAWQNSQQLAALQGPVVNDSKVAALHKALHHIGNGCIVTRRLSRNRLHLNCCFVGCLRAAGSSQMTMMLLHSVAEMMCEVLHYRDTLQLQLSAYQMSMDWPPLMGQELINSARHQELSKGLQAVREMSCVALAQSVQADRQKEYSWAVYWRAVQKAWDEKKNQICNIFAHY